MSRGRIWPFGGGLRLFSRFSTSLIVKALADIRGVLHAHTTESEGADTLEDMAQATKSRGYAYLSLTDHSQTAHYAGGLKADEVKRADRTHRQGGFRPGDHDPRPCHGTTAAETARLRSDMERILQACAEHGVAIEINANPWRLDLDWRWCARGLELGCLFSINPDAHSTEEIDNIQWGVLMARKGAVPKDRVLNTMTLAQFKAHLHQRKENQTARLKCMRRKAR